MDEPLHDRHTARRARSTILMSLGVALLFEATTAPATQDAAVRASSPWQDDPYDVAVSTAQFVVPMLAVVIGLRLLAWRGPGGPDRAQQMVRAAAAMTALVGATAGCEWIAVADGAHRSAWTGWTWLLIAGLVATSVLSAVVGGLLMRCRAPRGASAGWQHDWLGDAVLLVGQLPVVRRWSTPAAAASVRRHAVTSFLVLSLVAAVAVVGPLAVGERWTDPLLIGWALVVEVASNVAFCAIGNAIAGFVGRPPLDRTRRVTETAVVSGCVAVQLAVAFRDPLWHLVGAGSLTSVPALVVFTLGAGLGAAVITAAALSSLSSPPGANDPRRPTSVGRMWTLRRHV